jgi:hypothetical protein
LCERRGRAREEGEREARTQDHGFHQPKVLR